MAKVEDYKQYWLELAKKAGVPDDQANVVATALDNESVRRAFRDGFKATPDYSHDLDQVRDRTRGEAQVEAKAFYDKWFAEEGKPAYERAIALAKDHQRYKELYGDLTDSTPSGSGTAPQFLTRETAEQLINQSLAARDSAYVGLTKNAMRFAVDYYRRFGEVLDPDALEKFANDSKSPNLEIAYKGYIEPRVKETEAKDMEAKIKAAREEGAREALSRHKIPVDSKPRDSFHPLLNREAPTKDSDPTKVSRDSFLEGWNNWEQEKSNK